MKCPKCGKGMEERRMSVSPYMKWYVCCGVEYFEEELKAKYNSCYNCIYREVRLVEENCFYQCTFNWNNTAMSKHKAKQYVCNKHDHRDDFKEKYNFRKKEVKE